MTWEEVWTAIKTWILSTGIKIVVAIVILFVSFKLINFFAKRLSKRIAKKSKEKKIDKTIANTVSYIIKIVCKVIVVMSVVAYLGIDVSGVTALIASTGVGIGLAINGALSNLAGGILLLVTRPFKEDDYVSACGHEGTVVHIRLCHTVIRTPDNKMVYIPNSSLSSGTVVNFTETPTRRLDMAFSIDYSEDYNKAKKIIADIFERHELVLKDPAPIVRVSEHAESSINLLARCFVLNENYWAVKFDVTEEVKTEFDKNGISIPFPQLDVHMK